MSRPFRHAAFPTTLALAVAGAVLSSSACASGWPHYRVTDLTLSASASAEALGVNASGVVAGVQSGAAVTWLPDGSTVVLGSLGGTISNAYGINDAGQVVGSAGLADSEITQATRFEGGTVTDLGGLTPGFTTDGDAQAVNAAGWIVGYSQFESALFHATLWRPGAVVDLGLLPGTTSSRAFGINTAGDVCGTAYLDGSGTSRGFVWHAGRLVDLQPGVATTVTEALGINDAGQVVGSATLPVAGGKRATQAYVFARGRMRALGFARPGDVASRATAINGAGRIVGTSFAAHDQVAFVSDGKTMVDLNTLAVGLDARAVLSAANAVNDQGVIVGMMTVRGARHAFLATPLAAD